MTWFYPWETNADGTQTRLRDNEDGTFTIEYRQDVTDILEANKRDYASYARKFGQEPGEVVRLPEALVVKIAREKGVEVLKMRPEELRAFIRRELQSNEYQHLWRGNVRL